MPLPEPTYNELGLLIFPEWIITRTGGGEDFATSVVRVGKRENRNSQLATGYQRISVGGATIHEYELLAWNTFRALVKGAWKSFLIRNIRHCRLDEALIGIGNGEQTVFQVQLVGTYEDQIHTWPVKYIDHNYPPRHYPDGRVCWPTQYLRIFVDGVEKHWITDWTLDRNTGLITFLTPPADDAEIRVTGYFLTRVRFLVDYAPTQIEDSLDSEIPDGCELIEVEE